MAINLEIDVFGCFGWARPAARTALLALTLILADTGSLSHAQSNVSDANRAALVAAARTEGKATLYLTAVASIGERIAAAFKKAHPDIALELFRGTAGQVIPRIDRERAAGADGADVVITSDISWLKARANEGALLKASADAAGRWPSRYVLGGAVYIAAVEPLVIIYNKNLVKTRPRSFTDLLAPEFKGKLGTSDIAAPAIVAFYDWAEKNLTSDYLVRLKAQNPKLYNGGTPMSQAVASGEIAASGIAAVPANAKALLAVGAPIDYVAANPGVGIAYGVSSLAWSKRPNAARVLLDFILSAEGQSAWHGAGESASPLPGIPGSLDASTITPWDPDAFPPEVVRAHTARFNGIFKTNAP